MVDNTSPALPSPLPSAQGSTSTNPAFDFGQHRQRALDEYQPLQPLYADFARSIYSILTTCLDRSGIKVHSVQHRAKDLESYAKKSQTPAEEDPEAPKYPDPMRDITDLAGIRVITYFPSTESLVDAVIERELDVMQKSNKSDLLAQEERLGYHSIHYLVRLRDNRNRLPEYSRFRGLVAEIQVRTVLQHAWAEIEHDIQYKAATALPTTIRRRFMTLAGLLEIADREFQAIEDDSRRLQSEARESVAAGRLDAVEITPDALKAYLDRRYGPDGRMRDFSYQWTSRLLRRLGFAELAQLDVAIAPYDHDHVSRVLWGNRQGQLTRLEDVLLASMGDEFVRRHFWNKPDNDWYQRSVQDRLQRLRAGGIPIGAYRPGSPAPGQP